MFQKTSETPQIPTIIVVLGATGDLMGKKITPALFNLFKKDSLPDMFKVIGFARRDWTDRDFTDVAFETLKKHHDIKREKKTIRDFLSLYSYQRGFFEEKSDYRGLSRTLKAIDQQWGMCSNKLFYLAVPPGLFPGILKNLAAAGLNKPCGGPDEGWTRVIVEKPFGSDLKSARDLDTLLHKFFKEKQIYRIDHYLAKETFQNVMVFRFFNNLFEDSWGNETIESIHVRELENVGAEGRGSFYDGVGALRDVGQNHLLQMIALATMDQPGRWTADAVRKSRADLLKTLHALSLEEVRHQTFRAQYNGYRTVKGVTLDSDTETYFKVKFSLDHPRWRGVQFTMEAGKRLIDPETKDEVTEIEVVFKHSEPCLCPPGRHYKNSLIFRQDPQEGITVHFWSKKPGFDMKLEERTFNFNLRKADERTQYTEEYEKLLLDCINDNQMLFVSSGEIEAMWKFIDPIVAGWRKGIVPLHRYDPDAKTVTEHATSSMEGAMLGTGLKKEIGIVGLGKMGANIARHLAEKGWDVHAWNRTTAVADSLAREGIKPARSVRELVEKLPSPKLVWVMLPASAQAVADKPALSPVDEIIFGNNGLIKLLKKGDTIIDGGNSFFEDSIRRAKQLKKFGIRFLDVGTSGGPGGARNGACLMIGGEKKDFEYWEPLFYDLALRDGYGYMGKAGAGHFVKMVHNGIEYGMMQAIAEGFAVVKKSKLSPDLKRVARVYGRGSVITSRLIDWLRDSFEEYGDNLKTVSGTVAHTGEGEWTVKTAKKLGVPVKIIEDSFKFRVYSEKHPSYTGQILSALRNQFGGHSIETKKKK